jgi:Type IV secretion system pilin
MNLKYIKNNISSIFFLLSSFLFLVPNVSFAFFEGVSGFLGSLKTIIGGLIPIVFSLSVLFFFWGVAQFVLNAGDEKKIKEGKSLMIWGVIAIFVMSTLWSIVKLLGDSVGVETPNFGPTKYNLIDPDSLNNG